MDELTCWPDADDAGLRLAGQPCAALVTELFDQVSGRVTTAW